MGSGKVSVSECHREHTAQESKGFFPSLCLLLSAH